MAYLDDSKEDLALIERLYKNSSLNEQYLRQLCEQEEIILDIRKVDQWYPSFSFKIDLVNEKEKENKTKI